MKYLKISNPSVAPIEAFTLFGASTSRGTDKIGQFGTGAKNAMLLLMRKGVPAVVYRGKDKLEYSTTPIKMKDGLYNQVTTIENGGEPVPRDYVLELGELNWNTVDMALREFISNAIDESGFDNCSFGIVNEPAPIEGHTTVYVAMSPEVSAYWYSIAKYFLHFRGKEKEVSIGKSTPSTARIYRKGVFVREMTCRKPSLFDYNLVNLEIDDCRISNDGSVDAAVGTILMKDSVLIAGVLNAISKGQDVYEINIPSYNLYPDSNRVLSTWKALFGETLITNKLVEVEVAARKGRKAMLIPFSWYSILSGCGVPVVSDIILDHESAGYVTVPTKSEHVATLLRVWRKMTEDGIHRNKTMPKLVMFSGDDSGLYGYYSQGTVYINVDHGTNVATYVEECIRYVSEAMDYSRDFQEFCVNWIARGI